jgi:hypothetical protein
MYNVTLRGVSITTVAVENDTITYYDRALAASVILHKKRMRLILLPSVASLALPYFFTLSLNGTLFEKKRYST